MTLLTAAFAFAVFGAGACQSMQEGGDTVPSGSDTSRDRAAGVAESVRFTLDRSTYRAGAPVTLRLTNASSRRFGYNPCTRTIEQLSNGAWTPFPEPDRICTMELRLLAPTESISAQTELPSNIARGSYRMSIALSDENTSAAGPQRAVSGTFTVE